MKLKYKVPGLFWLRDNQLSGWSYLLPHQLLLVLICMLGGISGYANAHTWSGGCPVREGVDIPSTINVDPTLPIGSIIGSTAASWGSNTVCAGSIVSIEATAAGRFIGYDSHGNQVYATNNPGIGISMSIAGIIHGIIPAYGSATIIKANMPSGSLYINFVKMGAISSPVIIPPTALVYLTQVAPLPKATIWSISTSNATTLQPTFPTCTTSNPVIPITLAPVVGALSLNNAGDTTGDKPFKLQLSCIKPTNISLQFSGEFVNASQAVYKNTNATTGSSVGVQILKDGNPVPNGSGNKMSLGTVTGDISPEFTARYYALTNNVVAGDVTAVAFADIIYN